MANDDATVWGGQIRLGRKPENNELLVGNADGGFALTPSSSVIPTVDIQTLLDGISNTQGSILYRDASDWVALPPADSGYVLQTNGVGNIPSWVPPSSYTPSWTDVVKSADQSVSSSTTPVNATDLSFSVLPNTYYSFEICLLYSNASGNLRLAVTFPSSPTALMYAATGLDYWGTGYPYPGQTTSGGTINLDLASGSGTVFVNGYLDNGSNAGTVQLQFAQTISSSSATTLRKGSWLRYRTVP